MAPTDPAAQLESMGITLPEAPKPVASYIPTRRSGNQVFVSGQIPIAAGELLAKGVVPTKTSLETATACARQCTLNALACLKAEIGDLCRVTRVVKVGVFVASESGFGDQPKIANGCSDLLVEVFGSAVGQHARAAVGVSALPLDVPVEIEFIFEVQ